MPKIKTHKGLAKRIIVKKSHGKKKFFQRVATQDHFNARERGKDKRFKRKIKPVSRTNERAIRLTVRG